MRSPPCLRGAIVKPCRVIVFCLLGISTSLLAQRPGEIQGYTQQSSAAERDWEKKFQDGVVADHLRESMRRLSARPHHVGSPYDKDNAEWLLTQFKSYGFDAHIETFEALFPTPKERVL